MTGQKFDEDKLRYDLIEPNLLKGLAAVLTSGAKKYDEHSWKDVANMDRRYTSALMRHLEARRSGEYYDPESHELHTSHMAANVMFLNYLDNIYNLGVIHEDTNVQRRNGKFMEINTATRRDHPVSDEPDHDKELEVLRHCLEEVTEVLSDGSSYKPLGARLHDLCDKWSKQIAAGSTD